MKKRSELLGRHEKRSVRRSARSVRKSGNEIVARIGAKGDVKAETGHDAEAEIVIVRAHAAGIVHEGETEAGMGPETATATGIVTLIGEGAPGMTVGPRSHCLRKTFSASKNKRSRIFYVKAPKTRQSSQSLRLMRP